MKVFNLKKRPESPSVIVGELPLHVLGALVERLKEDNFLATLPFQSIIAHQREEDVMDQATEDTEVEYSDAGEYYMFETPGQNALIMFSFPMLC